LQAPGSAVSRGCGMRQRALACVLVAAACGGASQSNVRPLGGILTVAPATLDFGDVALGREQTHRVVLRNTGLVSMTVGQLAQFADPAFEVKGLPATLGPGSAVDVAVRYRPPGLGMHERMLRIVTDSPASNGADVDLRGHAVRGLATLSGDSFDFGPVVVNETATQDLLVTNGDGRAETAITVAPPLDKGVFSVDPGGEQILPSQQSIVVRLQFRPDRLGSFSSAIPITPCPTCSPRSITLTGKGVDKLLLVQPETLDFGELRLAAEAAQPLTGTGIGPVLQALPKSLFVGATALGTTRTAPVTVTNVGVDPKNVVPLVLTGVWIDGNDGTWAVQGGAMTVGPPGANIDLRVSFTPITTGVSHAALVIESNDGLHPHVEVPLAAIGRDLLPCKLAVLPGNPVDFGAQRVFVPIVEGYELVNQTADDCIVGEPEIVAGAPEFRWPGGIVPSGRTLPPGKRMSVRLEFMASQARTYSGAVRFYVSNQI